MAKTLKQLFTEQDQNIVQGRFHPEQPKKPIRNNVIVTPSVTEDESKLYKYHQELRKKSGLPDPSYYTDLMKKMKAEREAEKNSTNEEVVQEGRPSQRHTLEGHDYHKKTNDELIHIAKDAHKAAEAMKSHNTDAENKYRDQANDSATVRYFRQKNGMPEWYKKKYGHIKEQMSNAPFDPPYAKKTGTHIDKSGAKHGPMSVARDLARAAIAKQTKTMNKSEPTRKADIVREAMKDAAIKDEKKKGEKKVTSGGKDKFQPDPEISTQIIRQE